jgi:ubiquitin carboxyl-terminal hydrolase 36/42
VIFRKVVRIDSVLLSVLSIPSFPLITNMQPIVQPTGLLNLGNTCFLNAVLQALRMCPPLVNYLLKDRTRTPATRRESKKGPLVSALQLFFADMEAPVEPVYRPVGIVTALLNTVRACDDDWYQPRQQADAAECIQYLLDGIHDAVYRQVRITIHGEAETREQHSQMKALQSWSQYFAKEFSPIVENFYGQYQICIECTKCKNVSERFEPWLMLKAPIPGGHTAGADVPTLEACMSAAFAPEMIPGYACEHCKSPQTAVMTTRISKLPNILLFTFKRFTNTGAKIRGQIDWDLDALSLRPWMAFGRCPFSCLPISGKFRTFAVIEHCGSARGGHYRMFARKEQSWLECDDEAVQAVPTERVISADSYVIFAVPQ